MTQIKKSNSRMIRLSLSFRKLIECEDAGVFSARFEITESVER